MSNVVDVSAILLKSAALRRAASEQDADDERLRAEAIAAGQCPCVSDAVDPGPHLFGCPWADPNYDGEVTP